KGKKCVRCGKEIDSLDANSAKHIINPKDKRTHGINKIEKIVKSKLSKNRVTGILKEHKLTMQDFLHSKEIYPDEYGRREIVIEEEIEVSKTAIICLDCVQEDDTIIW
ncbi:unnamed protein product, partial [marine sediment metagenome]